ncbi:MAG TPA: PEGA domain-containing protein [Kofleriaceae bacterium]|nr:PEGA domain-containing protein [Kofleriaceae bacterium]
MSKALSSLCLFVLLICFGGSAWADKQKIAVLGLEVAPGPGGTVDPTTTQIAREITRELRLRAQSGTSPFMLAPNSQKELTDEKLLMSCDNEAKDCMAVIGAGLATDMLLYGRVERKGELYRVTLKLLDVKAKTVVPASDEMPVGASPAGVAKRLYGKLIGETGGASLVVTAHGGGGAAVDGGKVFVDEERVGELANGKLATTVSEGRHTVAIEAGGYRRFEEQITVKPGQASKLDVALVERGSAAPDRSPSSGSSNTVWKVTLGASIAVAVIGGGLAGISAIETQRASEYTAATMPGSSTKYPDPEALTQDDCGKSDADLAMTKHSAPGKNFRSNCSWRSRIPIGVGIGVVGVAGIVVSTIMLTRDHGSEKATAERRHKPISDVALAPVVTPDQTGAALSFRW